MSTVSRRERTTQRVEFVIPADRDAPADLIRVYAANDSEIIVFYETNKITEDGGAERPQQRGHSVSTKTTTPDPEFVEQLAADLCDRAMRPARTAYHPGGNS